MRSATSSSHYSSCHLARPGPPSGPSAAGCADGSAACRRRSSRTPRAARASQCCNTAQRQCEQHKTRPETRPAGKRWCAPGVAGGDGAEGGVSDARGEKRPRGVVRRHPLPTAVRCQPRQQALRPADCAERKHMQVKCRPADYAERKHMTCKSSVVIWKQPGQDSRRQRRPQHTAQVSGLGLQLGGAHRLEEGVDVAHEVAEVGVGARVLREELAADHLAVHALR